MIYSFPGASHLLTPTQAWDQTHTGGSYIPSPQGTCASLYKLPAGAKGFLKKAPNPGEAAQPMLEFLSERACSKKVVCTPGTWDTKRPSVRRKIPALPPCQARMCVHLGPFTALCSA